MDKRPSSGATAVTSALLTMLNNVASTTVMYMICKAVHRDIAEEFAKRVG